MISVENKAMHFVAKAIALENENILTIQLGSSIIFLDVENTPSDFTGWIAGEAKKVNLYPTNI